MPIAKTDQKCACVHTHGCRLNQAESEMLCQGLQKAGYQLRPWNEPVDLAIINTCTVTREAEAKCRQSIRKVIRHNPEAFVAVIGCYSQTGAKALAAIEGVDLIVGNQDKMSTLDYVKLGKNEHPVILRERIDRSDFSMHFVGDLPASQRANLKIQDGCDFMCAFCIIPKARGRARSRNFSNILEEARTLAGNGVREVVLTGVNIGLFSGSGKTLVDLIDALDALPGLQRIRISSIEPTTIAPELFERMDDPGHSLLPYLHIPLQSGSDRILKQMRRRYTVTEYLNFIEKAQASITDLCLGTDIMVGHPGETKADFEETCRVFMESPLAYSHVFPYSERPGTLAVQQAGSVPPPERHYRSAQLRRLSTQKRTQYYQKFLGRELDVLFENKIQDAWSGYTANFIRVRCPSPTSHDLSNQILSVRLESICADFVEASLIDN